MQDAAQTSDAARMRRFIYFLVFALVFSGVIGIASLWTGILSFTSAAGPSGRLTTYTYHTLATRLVMGIVVGYHFVLSLGILWRRRAAWRAGFALPGVWSVWALAANVFVFNPPHATLSDILLIVIILGMGTWITLTWRRQWIPCEPFFTESRKPS